MSAHPPTPRDDAGTCGVGGRPDGAADRSPVASSPHGNRRFHGPRGARSSQPARRRPSAGARAVGNRVAYSPDLNRISFGEASARVKPPPAVAGLVVAASSVVRPILEVLLSLLFALSGGTRWSRRMRVVRKSEWRQLSHDVDVPRGASRKFSRSPLPIQSTRFAHRSSAG